MIRAYGQLFYITDAIESLYDDLVAGCISSFWYLNSVIFYKSCELCSWSY